MNAGVKDKFNKGMLAIVLVILLAFYCLSMKPAVAVARHFGEILADVINFDRPVVNLTAD